jgi:hypothetical protein
MAQPESHYANSRRRRVGNSAGDLNRLLAELVRHDQRLRDGQIGDAKSRKLCFRLQCFVRKPGHRQSRVAEDAARTDGHTSHYMAADRLKQICLIQIDFKDERKDISILAGTFERL